MIILDRFEGSYAVMEIDGEIVKVERHILDSDVKEGDVLVLKDGIYYTDYQATSKRKQHIANKFKDMWED